MLIAFNSRKIIWERNPPRRAPENIIPKALSRITVGYTSLVYEFTMVKETEMKMLLREYHKVMYSVLITQNVIVKRGIKFPIIIAFLRPSISISLKIPANILEGNTAMDISVVLATIFFFMD